MSRETELINAYHLEQHPEGGWFAECYTSPDEKDGRALAGSIYFLLQSGEISQLHQIDCEEVWYFHEGCGLKITVYMDGVKHEYKLGTYTEKGERVMVVVPKGAIFGAENLEEEGFTFVSCMTTPKFTYAGFRLVDEEEIRGIQGL